MPLVTQQYSLVDAPVLSLPGPTPVAQHLPYGYTRHVVYTTYHRIAGKHAEPDYLPENTLSYQDPARNVVFVGDEITTQESALGEMVTVELEPSQAGSGSSTLWTTILPSAQDTTDNVVSRIQAIGAEVERATKLPLESVYAATVLIGTYTSTSGA